MKVINCFVLSICLFIAGCGNFEWFPADKTAKFPVLTKAFGTATATIGQAVTLTFTITNASGNPAQSGLAFTDTLPGQTANSTIGMFVANPLTTTGTTCTGSIATSGTTSVGDTVLTFSGGSIGAGPATCAVTVQVTSNASTTNLTVAQGQAFINGFNNMSNVSSNLNNTVSNQLLAFSPFPATATINGVSVTIQARDLVVTTNGTTSFSLLVDNISTTNSANVTVTVTGYDSSGATVATEIVQATPVTLAANATGIPLTLTGVTANAAILTWHITGITITAP